MEAHEELLEWAESIGVSFSGIRPLRLSGRGFGLVATKRIAKDEVILQVPITALRTLDTVPRILTQKLPKDMKVHGLLAADLSLDKTTKFRQWSAVLPTWQDLQTMPITWPAELQAQLPIAAKKLLKKQENKFRRDFGIVTEAFPTVTYEGYLYAWLLVNTRTFYFTTPKTEKLHRDDHMALQPVADLLNHADVDGCTVAFDDKSFTIKTNKEYAKGEEIFISYGRHSNDFLLVEYGFVLAQNKWDEVCLDDVILPALSAAQKEDLEEVSFLGNYVLDSRTVCHRTQVALRIMCVPLTKWKGFVDGVDDDERNQTKVDVLLVKLLRKYEVTITKTLKSIDAEKKFDEEQTRGDLLQTRWAQIQSLITSTIQRLET